MEKHRVRLNLEKSEKIHGFLDKLIPGSTDPAEMCPEGEDVVLHTCSNIEEETAAVSKVLKNLLDESTPPGDIVILINSTLAQSSIADLKRIGKTQVEWMSRSYRRDSRSIQIASIDSFKGLEAPIVIILGPDSDGDKNRSYTQASRANLMLHIFQ